MKLDSRQYSACFSLSGVVLTFLLLIFAVVLEGGPTLSVVSSVVVIVVAVAVGGDPFIWSFLSLLKCFASASDKTSFVSRGGRSPYIL